MPQGGRGRAPRGLASMGAESAAPGPPPTGQDPQENGHSYPPTDVNQRAHGTQLRAEACWPPISCYGNSLPQEVTQLKI